MKLSALWSRIGARAGLAVLLMASPASAGEPLPVDRYGRLPLVESPRLSPDGSMIAFLSPRNGRRCIRVQNLFGDQPHVETICPGTAEVRWFAWKSNSRLLASIYLTTPEPDKPDRLYLQTDLIAVDIDGGHQVNLVKARRDYQIDLVRDKVIDFLRDDPGHVLVLVVSALDAHPDVIRVDINTGEETVFAPANSDTVGWFTDGWGHVDYSVGWVDRKPELRHRSDETMPFTPVAHFMEAAGTTLRLGMTDAVTLAAGPRDKPDWLYYLSSIETGRSALYLYDVKQGHVIDRVASSADSDIEGLIDASEGPVGYTITDDRSHQVYFNPTWQREQASLSKALPGKDIAILDRTADGQHVLVQADSGSLPGTFYLLARIPGKATQLTQISRERPEIPDDQVAPVRPITYVASDGLKIRGYLTLPPGVGKGPIPFVVLPHGGPIGQDYVHFDFLAQMIASRGYGVLQPNFRGSSGQGTAFEETGFQQWGRKMQDDITDGTHWLIDQGLADPKRICIVGWSYGGYAALMGAIREPGLYRCAASMAGPTDLRGPTDWTDHSHNYILKGDAAVAAENSPLRLVDRIMVPVLLAHGRQDVNVPVQDTEKMEKALRDAGKKVDAIYFDLDDHFLRYEGYRIQFVTRLAQFLKDNLGS